MCAAKKYGIDIEISVLQFRHPNRVATKTRLRQREAMAKIKPLECTTSKYGATCPVPASDIEWELGGIRNNFPNGLSKLQHVKNALRMLHPDLAMNDWAEDQIESIFRTDYAKIVGNTVHRTLTWTGPAAAGKTCIAANAAFVWWLSDPYNSFVVLTSTTSKMVRKRVWPNIQKVYFSARKNMSAMSGISEDKVILGNLVDSKTMLQVTKGDDLHGIFAVAVEEGDVAKAMAQIQGMHAPRILMIVDEATDTSDAIIRVCENLKKGCQDFTLLLIGNASPGLNPHTEYSEPVNGWSSVTVEDYEWRTKVGGLCIHFDGFKSPNVKKGRTIFPFLYTYEDYLMDVGKEDDADTWKYSRGYWAPEGVRDTIFTTQMVERCDVHGKLNFISWSYPVASLDPGFGGDKCVYRKGRMGDIDSTGKIGIQLDFSSDIKAKATDSSEVDKQIAEQVIALNRQHGVLPEHFGMDATGTGRGVFSHIYSDWSGKIYKCLFGGSPSNLPASVDDIRASADVYDRKVTELWFAVSEFVQGMQLKGMNRNEIAQFCARKFKDEKRKKSLETKDKFKLHYRQDGKNCSPDEADAVAVLIDLVRHLGGVANGTLKTNPDDDWEQTCKVVNAVYTDVDYSEDNAYEDEARYIEA